VTPHRPQISDFVAALINGVFGAVLKTSLQQMETYARSVIAVNKRFDRIQPGYSS
jgi:hypothetical protein